MLEPTTGQLHVPLPLSPTPPPDLYRQHQCARIIDEMNLQHTERVKALFHETWIGVASLTIVFCLICFCLILLSAIFLVLFPRARQLHELTATLAFVLAVLEINTPALFELPYVPIFIPFIVGVSVYSMTYGTLMAKLNFKLTHREQNTFFADRTAEVLWQELVPLPENKPHHWDPLLQEVAVEPTQPNTYHALYLAGLGETEIQTQVYTSLQAPHHARYTHISHLEPKSDDIFEGTYEVDIQPHLNGLTCNVTITAELKSIALAEGILMWFDDSLRDGGDAFLSRHEDARDWSIHGLIRRILLKHT